MKHVETNVFLPAEGGVNLVDFGTVGHESMAEEYPKNRKSQKIGKPKGHDGHDAVLQRLERRWSTRAELLQQKRSTIK